MILLMSVSSVVYGQSSELMKAASNVDEVSGGYTFAVILLSIAVVALFTISYLLHKENIELTLYIRDMAKEAVGSIKGVEGVLGTVQSSQEKIGDKLSEDHSKMKEDITKILSK